MQFRMFTHNGFKVAVPVSGVRFVEQDPDAPAHSILHVFVGVSPNLLIPVDEDYFTVISRLNTIS